MYVEIAYDLYEVNPDGSETLRHQVTPELPEPMVYGLTPGVIVPLADAIKGLEAGEHFECLINPEEGFGQYDDSLLRTEDLPRSIFEQEGKLDTEKIHPGAQIYLQTNVGQEVKAVVLAVNDTTVQVKVDFNHPLAGVTLKIKGTIITVRPATAEEIAAQQPSCGGCGGGCSSGDCGDGGCCGGCGE